jgi:ribosomal protein L37E
MSGDQQQFTPDGRRIFKTPTYLDDNGVLTCPRCGCQDFEVTHSYRWEGGHKPRRRVCTHCGYPITTIEVVDETL